MMERIKLPNRDKLNIYLEPDEIEENLYSLKGEISSTSLIGKEGDNIININDLGAVDPPGGPFISKGDKIPGTTLTVERIFGVDNLIKIKVQDSK